MLETIPTEVKTGRTAPSPADIVRLLGALLLALAPGAARAQTPEWHSYGGDAGGARFSTLRQINRRNVTRLERAWTYHTGELPRVGGERPLGTLPAFQCTPLVVEGVMYLTTPTGRVRRILFGTIDGQLIALDAEKGTPSPDFGAGGVVDLRRGIADRWPDASYDMTSPPAVYKDLVIVGARIPESPGNGPSGDVRALDVRTGKLVWQFHTVPRPGEVGHETWANDSWKDRTGANVWSVMSVDEERGMVFLPVGSPAYDFYGGDRPGQNLFGNSLVALNAADGKLIWHFQTVHHDLWDYDPPAQPNLVTVTHMGRRVPAVVLVTKMGFVFVLDRVTGRPLFPVEERSVPQSTVPGESSWPTQPFPTKPPPLARQRAITAADITTVTPESHKYCSELFAQLASGGLYTPLGYNRQTLWFPGTLGGATWSGASFDPASGYLYVNVNEIGAMGAMVAQPAGSAPAYRRESPWGGYARFWDENGWPCQQPPWGTLNAVDLNEGRIVWRVPLGVVDALEAKGVRGTGTPNLGGSIVTAGGLVFIGGSNDRRFRAFDARTGRELWSARLEASGHATPITYRGRKSGRQFVVIAAGGGGYFSRTASDAVVAFALPK